MLSIVTGSMPVNGSSSRISLGLETRQRAISRRRRSPPESDMASDLRRRAMLNCSSSSSQRRCRDLRSMPSISIMPSRLFSTDSLRKTLDSWAR